MKSLFFLVAMLLIMPFPVVAASYNVDRVIVEGNQRFEEKAILAEIGSTAGSMVTTDDIDKDLLSIFELGRFDDVAAEIVEQDGETLLVYSVVERPLIRKIDFEGNEEVSTSKLSPEVTIKIPDLYNPRVVAKSVEAIRAVYVEKGFHAVSIEPDLDVNDQNEATVIFRIKEGEKVLIDKIHFEGNMVFSDRKLRKSIQTRRRTFMSWLTDAGAYNKEILQTDLEIIKDMYFNEGYVQIKVKQPYVTLTEDKKYLEIFIQIEEGEQFSVGEVGVEGDMIAEPHILMEQVTLMEGDIFSRKELRESMLGLNDFYADRGYAYVNVSPLTSTIPGKNLIDIQFQIEKGIQVAIGRIEIRGNTKTVDKVIRREMALVEGDLYSASALAASRRQINKLGFFEEINIDTSKSDDEKVMDVDIDLVEKPTGTFSIGAGYSSVDHFIFQGSVSQANFLGRGYKLNLSGSFGANSTLYNLGFTNPYFLDTNVSLGFDVYKTEREWTEYTENKVGGDVKVGVPVAKNMRAVFVYRYEQKEITDVDEFASLIVKDAEGESTLSSITTSLIRDTTDSYLDPSEGSRSEVSVEYAGIGGTEKFLRTVADHRSFFPWKWNTVFSVHGQVGQVFEVGNEEIPLSERFYLGGIRTIRGFKSRRVGPRVPVTGGYEYIGGEKEAYFNFEYIFPLAESAGLKAVLFFDTGNAWLKEEDFFDDMRYSVGGGIRWLSPLGPLRLEWGRNLDPIEGENNSELEFSIGRFF